MKKKYFVICTAILLLIASFIYIILKNNEYKKSINISKLNKSNYSNNVSVHDPSIVMGDDNKYYIFGSHMTLAKSDDLKNWEKVYSGVSNNNPLYNNVLSTKKGKAFEYVGHNDEGGYSIWAPDVIYNKEMNKYVIYFSASSTYIKSSIGFAVSDSIIGPYEYVDTIIYSGFTSQDIDKTNVLDITQETKEYYKGIKYNNMEWPNCIDPCIFYDKEDRMWMTYGSWSGGIFILEIDEKTGYPIHKEKKDTDIYFGKHLIGGYHNSIEGPYIVYDKDSDYYYLFVSYGSLTREGGYQIRVYRSKNPDGPYLDTMEQRLGKVVNHETYGLKLIGNYTLPDLKKAYMAPGHNSALIEDDKKVIVFHTRFDSGNEYHEPRAHQFFINEKGWPVLAPYVYSGESLIEKCYSENEILGEYYLVNHGLEISNKINKYIKVELTKNHEIIESKSEEILGTWNISEKNPYIDLIYKSNEYSGVIIEMESESGNNIMALTCVGNNNISMWAVKYLE